MGFLAFLGPLLAGIGGGSALAGAVTLGSLATTGIGIGEQLANQPGSSKPSPTSTAPVAQSDATNQAQTATAAQQLPTLQSLTGSSLSPEYFSQWAGIQTGLGNNPQAAGNIQGAINSYFGLGAPTQGGSGGLTAATGTSPSSPTGNSVTDILSSMFKAGGGAAAGGGGGSSIVDQSLQQDFRGFS